MIARIRAGSVLLIASVVRLRFLLRPLVQRKNRSYFRRTRGNVIRLADTAFRDKELHIGDEKLSHGGFFFEYEFV